MTASELRSLAEGELQTKLDEASEELMNLRFNQVTGKLTDFTKIRSLRRDIARMETILHEMVSAGAVEGVA